jgi:hypothetical protein
MKITMDGSFSRLATNGMLGKIEVASIFVAFLGPLYISRRKSSSYIVDVSGQIIPHSKEIISFPTNRHIFSLYLDVKKLFDGD